MNKATILVVEDDADILELIEYNLTREHYTVKTAMSGEKGLQLARELRPDLLVLDLMLPGMDGLEVCRRLRNDAEANQIAILMLTAKGEEADVVAGLELGADDYMTKPFSPRVLVARIRALLRRKDTESIADGATITTNHLTIDSGRHEVLVDGMPVELTLTEFRLLYCLARRPGWVFTRNQIIDFVRSNEYIVTERAVDVQVAGLRKKLGRVSSCIKTVRGVGYKYEE